MAKTYAWRDGGPKPKVSAQVFGEAVERLSDDAGSVSPDTIVKAAQAPKSPLHGLFVWSNTKAADLYRREQARSYLGRLQVVRVRESDGETVSDKGMFFAKPKGGRAAYFGRDDIASDSELRVQAIGRAKRELESFITKYRDMLALGTYIPRLQETVDAMRDEIDALEMQANAKRRTRRNDQPARPDFAEAAE